MAVRCSCRFLAGEGCHEEHHVRFAADQQREDPAELGSAVHETLQSGQCSELHNKLGRWTCL